MGEIKPSHNPQPRLTYLLANQLQYRSNFYWAGLCIRHKIKQRERQTWTFFLEFKNLGQVFCGGLSSQASIKTGHSGYVWLRCVRAKIQLALCSPKLCPAQKGHLLKSHAKAAPGAMPCIKAVSPSTGVAAPFLTLGFPSTAEATLTC